MSSFLALDISQFPWKDGKLSLSYVLKSLCKQIFLCRNSFLFNMSPANYVV